MTTSDETNVHRFSRCGNPQKPLLQLVTVVWFVHVGLIIYSTTSTRETWFARLFG